MPRYTIIKDGKVENFAEANTAFAQAQGWLLSGAEVAGDLWDGTAFAAPPAPAVDPAQLQGAIMAATQARLDDFAQTRNYDSILSACTYASSAIPKFAGEGQAAVNGRDATWAALYTVLAWVQAGELPVPTGFADIEPLLPALTWPD